MSLFTNNYRFKCYTLQSLILHIFIHGLISLGFFYTLKLNKLDCWIVRTDDVRLLRPSGEPAEPVRTRRLQTSIQRARVTLLKLRGAQSWESPRFLKESRECPFSALSPSDGSTSPEWHSGRPILYVTKPADNSRAGIGPRRSYLSTVRSRAWTNPTVHVHPSLESSQKQNDASKREGCWSL